MLSDRGQKQATADPLDARQLWADELARPGPVAGVPGPGQWLVATFAPVALFSLKTSLATSSVGKTLLVPTFYALKMALVDAAFRAGLSEPECDQFLQSLARVEARISPPERAVVTQTFVKVRQEPKAPDKLRPFVSSIAYREVVHHHGLWRWAFDLAAGDALLADRLAHLLPHVNYVGKRGSFVQFLGLDRAEALGADFTQALSEQGSWQMPPMWHVAELDDFGPDATLQVLSTYSDAPARRDRHRRFVRTIVPLGLANTGPGFTEYRSVEEQR
ncbi:MAG: hypothetical protein HY690_15080 [Chloroflexi bacterium]|nr:hypothetical protein [Chloroflexota bacterium]